MSKAFDDATLAAHQKAMETYDGKDVKDVPFNTDLPIGTVLTWNGRKIKLVMNDDPKNTKCPEVHCVFWEDSHHDNCRFCNCNYMSRKDCVNVHWEWVEDSEPEEDADEDDESDDIPEDLKADLPLGTEHEYNGRIIRLVEDDDTHGCDQCAFCDFSCVGMYCTTIRREDNTAVHWAYVDELDDDDDKDSADVKGDLPVGTVREYNGRKIVLADDDGECVCSLCVFKGTNICADIVCNQLSRKDNRNVHWEYVDEAAPEPAKEGVEIEKLEDLPMDAEDAVEFPIGKIMAQRILNDAAAHGISPEEVLSLADSTGTMSDKEEAKSEDIPKTPDGRIDLDKLDVGDVVELGGVKYRIATGWCRSCPLSGKNCGRLVKCSKEFRMLELVDKPAEGQELTTEIMKSYPPIGSEYMWKGRRVRVAEDTSDGGCSRGGCAVRTVNDCSLSCGYYCNGLERPDGKRVHLVFADECDKPRDEEKKTDAGDAQLPVSFTRIASVEDMQKIVTPVQDFAVGTILRFNDRAIKLVEDTDGMGVGEACQTCVLYRLYCGFCKCSRGARSDGRAVHWEYMEESAEKLVASGFVNYMPVNAITIQQGRLMQLVESDDENMCSRCISKQKACCNLTMCFASSRKDDKNVYWRYVDEEAIKPQSCAGGCASCEKCAQAERLKQAWLSQLEKAESTTSKVKETTMTTTTSLFDQLFSFNGIFGKAPEGMFKFSAKGAVAVKTGAGYRAYNADNGYLVNCTMFNVDLGDGMFYILPTNKVAEGDIILVKGQPRYVLSADDRQLSVVNYESGTVETILPERHVFLGRTYFYGKLFSPFQKMFGGEGGMLKGIFQMSLISSLLGGKDGGQIDAAKLMLLNGMSGNGAPFGDGESNPFKMMLMMSLLNGDGALKGDDAMKLMLLSGCMGGKGDLFAGMLDGVFETPEALAKKPAKKPAKKSAAPKSVKVVDEEQPEA